MYKNWQPIIGLEIHTQLNTKTKLFSPAPNRFGDEPNTNITEICTGQPGSLPLLNKEAVHKAILFGLAIDAKIQKYSRFDRKSYFYPDSPRNFQITQFEKPIFKSGFITFEIAGEKKRVELDHAHLEDDAGMLKHFSNFTGIDYNRAGAPLLEIVSNPTLYSPKEASSFAEAVKSILEYVNASDCNMEKGQFRMDANISIRKKNEKTLRTKIEIKNINSFNFLEMAIEKEIQRQIKIYEKDDRSEIEQSTFRWDSIKKENIKMRAKETAEDYRYFPEPDIPPIIITEKYLEKVIKILPELPQKRYERYIKNLKLSNYNASILTASKKLSDYFENILKFSKNANLICSFITVEFPGKLKKPITETDIPPTHIANLVNLIDSKKITGKMAKEIADEMIENNKKDPIKIVEENPKYKPMNDEKEILLIVEKVVSDNPQSIEDYKKGREKALAFLIGQVMKITKGKANPAIVNKLILNIIKNSKKEY